MCDAAPVNDKDPVPSARVEAFTAAAPACWWMKQVHWDSRRPATSRLQLLTLTHARAPVATCSRTAAAGRGYLMLYERLQPRQISPSAIGNRAGVSQPRRHQNIMYLAMSRRGKVRAAPGRLPKERFKPLGCGEQHQHRDLPSVGDVSGRTSNRKPGATLPCATSTTSGPPAPSTPMSSTWRSGSAAPRGGKLTARLSSTSGR